MIDPIIINNFLNDYDFNNIKKEYLKLKDSKLNFDYIRERYVANDPASFSILELKTKKAREIFKSKTLLPTYAMYSKYVGPGAILEHHKDSNACTYTLDLCISSTNPWGLWVEGKEYVLEPNQALAYYGNDQEHWRNEMTWPGVTEMLFLHYAEPDHWWFKNKKNNTIDFDKK